jgi:hypothetical protein
LVFDLDSSKKEEYLQALSVADMRVSVIACFGDFDEFVKDRRHQLNVVLSLIVPASLPVITNSIEDTPLCYELTNIT